MKNKLITKICSGLLASLMIAAVALSFTSTAVEGASATTYTRTNNADGLVVRSQDGYIPTSTYDRIGLYNPIDMVIDKVEENGKIVEYAYVLNQGQRQPYITKFNIDDVTNQTSAVEKLDISVIPNCSNQVSGLFIQTTTINKVSKKELYIADSSYRYTEKYTANDGSEREYSFAGAIYRIPFSETNELLIDQYEIIREPIQINDDGIYERTPAFGETTIFKPTNIGVDTSGNMFISSDGTDAGMIQLNYYGEFISFFVVNQVEYNFLYQFVKRYGTAAQLDKLNAEDPKSFYNVFVDNNDIVYSVGRKLVTVFDKYSTSGSSILENAVTMPLLTTEELDLSDSFVTEDGLMFISLLNGMIYVYGPDGALIFFFGTNQSTQTSTPDIIGFFKDLRSIVVDSKNRIWSIEGGANGFIQTFEPTEYAKSIFSAITSFNNHDYETSRSSWEDVLRYDSLSVLANDGLGKAYYYDGDFQESLQYFSTSKNRALYSNVFWELRNDYLQQNLSTIIVIAVGIILLLLLLRFLFKKVKVLKEFKQKVGKIKDTRVFKDLTVGFRMLRRPSDTFYEMKCHRRGSMWGATIYYILAIIAFVLNTYAYALPFQYATLNTLSLSTVLFATIAVLFVFVLCNYLVSAINDGEGTFKDIYKFTGYCLLPMIICLPLGVCISYALTLNEQVLISFLKAIAFWGSGIYLVMGILETHNYTFTKTIKNVLLTIVFMLLFAIICMVVFIMVDQIVTLIETIWKEVKLRAGWY